MTRSESSPTRSAKAEARRQQILEAARVLFARHGYDATSTKRIAQEVGVTEGLIFHYFPTKGDLLRAVARERKTFMGEVQALLAEAADEPARQVLGTIVLGWVEAIHRQSDLVLMLLIESQTHPELDGVFRALVGDTVGALSGYLDSRVRAGELRPDLPVDTSAMMFFSSLMMFFLMHRDLPEQDWHARARAFTAELLDVWLSGATTAPG